MGYLGHQVLINIGLPSFVVVFLELVQEMDQAIITHSPSKLSAHF